MPFEYANPSAKDVMNSRQLLLGTTLLTITAHASAAVTYDFFSQASPRPFVFFYVAPDFIRSDVTVPASAIFACIPAGAICDSVRFQPLNPEGIIASRLGFSYTFAPGDPRFGNLETSFFYFPLGSFSQEGVFTTLSAPGFPVAMLRVSVAPVPEPSTLGLVVTALAVSVVVARRATTSDCTTNAS
jgi:hypothetical protein